MAKTTQARRKPRYNPPATATPKTVCLLLVRPDGNIVVIQGQNSTWDDVGGRLLDNENIASGAARVVTKETGLTLQQLSAELIGSVYQRFSRAQVLRTGSDSPASSNTGYTYRYLGECPYLG